MATALQHYDHLLAKHFTWSKGAFSQQLADNLVLFERHGIAPRVSGAIAVDLGAGAGAQSIALAQLGFSVIALDQCSALLDELRQRAGEQEQGIRAVCDDLLNVAKHVASPAAVIVCMGDTLTHLPEREDVERLFEHCGAMLEPGGQLVISYRDLSHRLEGLDRFIPVRSDLERVFTCFLEYGEHTVMVHDLLYVREGDGWRFERSAYPKLRLASDWTRLALERAGLSVDACEIERGFVTLVATRN